MYISISEEELRRDAMVLMGIAAEAERIARRILARLDAEAQVPDAVERLIEDVRQHGA